MARFKGAWWSPDDRHVAIERFDEAHVGIVTRTSIGATGTKTFDQRYPAAGTPNAEVSIWIVKADGSGKVQVDLGPTRTSMSPVSTGRRAARRSMSSARPRADQAGHAEGRSRHRQDQRAVYRNRAAKMWLNVTDDYRFLKDGTLIWRSERDGFGHLYRFDPKAGTWTQLTKGDWVVTRSMAWMRRAASSISPARRTMCWPRRSMRWIMPTLAASPSA
jgi:dipeptidyl-peptidase-4